LAENPQPLILKGWKVLAHPLFLDQIEAAIAKVEKSRQKHPEKYLSKNAAKHLRALRKVAFDVIPADPTLSVYRQGVSLGGSHKNWFRAKFQQQYRLFFRYNAESKTIILAWVNDESCLRAYNSKTDAYTIFQNMLGKGNPPNDWESLLSEANAEAERLMKIIRPPQ
jgi:toxin YhaV